MGRGEAGRGVPEEASNTTTSTYSANWRLRRAVKTFSHNHFAPRLGGQDESDEEDDSAGEEDGEDGDASEADESDECVQREAASAFIN